ACYVKQPLLLVTDAESRIKLDRLARERLPLTHLHGELHLLGSTLNNTLDQLHETQDQLIQSAKMATTGELLAMIAHQWRQPLGTIGNQISNLQIRVALKNAEPEYLSKELEAVQKNLKFLSMTIKDFREFLKPNKPIEQIEILEVIQRAEDLFQSALAKNGVKLVKQLEKTQPLWTCPNELQQVLMNLIQNAQDVLLENEIVQKQISIRLKQDGAQQVLELEDNAGGIPKGLEEQIFQPYFTTKSQLNGTGLGLYMSKLIVEQHLKGKISVHNSHQGACFTIRLTDLAMGQAKEHKAA
ncbi:MAG: sensor histidine kinase, partial [bacterium]